MNPYAQTKQYKNADVASMTPGEQIARLLETAAKHMYRAKEHAEKKEYGERFSATEDAMKIIHGLQNCLSDDPAAEKMRDTLDAYYNSMTLLITRQNMKNDVEAAVSVIESLTEMAATWRQVDAKVRQENQAASATATPEAFSAVSA
jgi:flagellar biosynthetic protein FliS